MPFGSFGGSEPARRAAPLRPGVLPLVELLSDVLGWLRASGVPPSDERDARLPLRIRESDAMPIVSARGRPDEASDESEG